MGDDWAGANVGSPHLLSPRRVQCVGQYDLGKTIGSGQFGKVKLATHVLTKAKVAVKIINKTKLEPDTLVMVYREISIMKLLRHPNIIRLYEVVDTEKVLFLIMEYASGGEVLDFIVAHGRLGEKEARRFFRQILSAIAYCHKMHVVHRDLKCENLLLDKSLNIKIIDFGLSNHFTPGVLLKTFCGSPTYAAPELILKREYAGPEVDIWSMGVMLYVLVCGKLPFEGHDFLSLFTRILHADYKLPEFVSPDLASLLRSILVVDPKRRATLHQIMAHPWVTAGEDISMLYEPESPPLTADSLDEEVLVAMEKQLHFDRQTVSRSVLGNNYDDAAATYLLLAERRSREREEGKEAKDSLVSPSSTGPTPSPPPPESKQPVVAASEADHKKGKGHRRTRTVEGHIRIEQQDSIPRPPDPPSARPRPKGAHAPSPLRDSPSVDAPVALRNSGNNAPNGAARMAISPNTTPRVHISPPHNHIPAMQDPPDLALPASSSSGHASLTGSNPSNPNPNPIEKTSSHNPNPNPNPPSAPVSPTPQRPPSSLPVSPRDDKSAEVAHLSPTRIEQRSSGEPSEAVVAPHKRRGHQRHVSVDVHLPKKESKEGGLWESVFGAKGTSRRSSGKSFSPSPTPTPAPHSMPPLPPSSTHGGGPPAPVSPTTTPKKDVKASKLPALKLDGVAPSRPTTLVDSFKQSLGLVSHHSGKKEKAAEEPRSGRFAFNTATTSEKDPHLIISEIKELLKSMSIAYSETGPYSVDCFAGDIRFEIEVCKLPRLSISGLKMKRIAGDVWNYKSVVDKLVQRLNLSDVSNKAGSGIQRP